MEKLKYRIITSDEQYNEYCQIHHDINFAAGEKNQDVEDELDLLYLLIRTWDEEHNVPRKKCNPVEFLQLLMEDHKMKAKDLAQLLDVNKSYVSEILNYKKGFSKKVIRKLADRFKMREEAFSQPYKLKGLGKTKRKKAAKSGRSVKMKKKAA